MVKDYTDNQGLNKQNVSTFYCSGCRPRLPARIFLMAITVLVIQVRQPDQYHYDISYFDVRF